MLGLAAVGIIVAMVVATSYYAKQNFDFSIGKEKNILVLGNSRPEAAINDSLLPNVYNLAQGGSGYFYDHLKIQRIVEHNPQIDTLIIGYSYGDLKKDMDSWFSGKEKIKFKMRNHLFLFELEDYISLLKANPVAVAANTPQTIFHNIKMKRKGKAYLGGFKSGRKNEIKKAKELANKHIPDASQGYSKYQSEYLLKVYEYCKSRDIAVILINVPIHPMLEEIHAHLKPLYCKFAKEKLPDALLIDHANFKLPETDYRDLAHLNAKGAKKYTEFLRSDKFKTTLMSCPEN